MRKKVQIFLFFLVLFFSFFMMGCKNDNIKYTLSDDGLGYYFSWYNGARTEVKIPAKYNNLPVIGIGERAFYACSSITSVEIPDSVTYIGDYAFYACSSLTSVEIPKSVTYIGERAFSSCISLTNVEILTNFATIRAKAFSNCDSLSYNIYDNAKYLGSKENPYVILVEAVDSSVTSCEVNSNTKIVASYAFIDCKGLTNIEIPSGVEIVGKEAFPDYGGLTYNIYDNAKYLGNKENPYVLLVKALDKSIQSCEINNNAKIISNYAFSYCESLISVKISESVKYIDEYSFYDCDSLTSIEIPNGVTRIGDSAFFDSSALENIRISESVISIGKSAFLLCSLSNIEVNENNKVYNSNNNCNAIIETQTNKLILGSDNGKIPEGVKHISDYAFNGCTNLTNIDIPNSVIRIGNYAFYNCTGLTGVEIPSSVTHIGENAFGMCKNLTSIKIQDGVTYIGKLSFSYCDSLTSLEIPNSVTYIDEKAFCGCDNLTSIIIPKSVTSMGKFVFGDCYSLTIYCEAKTKPKVWSVEWNPDKRPVVWGYKEN